METKFKHLLLVTGVTIATIISCSEQDDGQFINDSSTTLQTEIIDIPNFENPETMWEESNRELYNKAYNKFMEHVYLEDGLYKHNIRSGKEIGVAEPIYDYIKENLQTINSQVEKGEAVLMEEQGEILYARRKLKEQPSTFSEYQEDYFGNRVTIWSTAGSEMTNRIGDAMGRFDSGLGGNFSDYFSWNSQIYNRTGTASYAGYNVTYHVSSSVSNFQENSPSNSFVSMAERTYGDYTYFDLRNNQGNTLMSIRAQDTAAANAVRNKINGN
jgi:hypothetical protein